jgi:16S rRNA (guanine527-N7)-methyltransferase
VVLPESFEEVLTQGLSMLGIAVDTAGRARLAAYAERLLVWNRKVNLTSVTEPAMVAELHLVDSLALLRTLGEAQTVLDIGSGAGLPGAALACVREDLEVTCCDSVHKKVAFVKAVAAQLCLHVRATAVRAAGDPESEGLPRCDAVVSRAMADPRRWLPLGARYLGEGGKVFAMLGRAPEDAELRAIAGESGLELEVVDRFVLPRSGASRAIARFRRIGGAIGVAPGGARG